MNDLQNLLIWFSLDKDGNPDYIVKMAALDAGVDLEYNFAKWAEASEHRKANIYTFTQENIEVPERVMAGPVSGNAFIMHYNGTRHRAIMPYFVTIGGNNDLEGKNVRRSR